MTSLFNSNKNIRQIQFFDEEVEIVFSDNTIKRFSFQDMGSNVITFEDIPQKLNEIIEINEDLNKSDSLKVRYEELYIFQYMYLKYFSLFFLFIFSNNFNLCLRYDFDGIYS